MKTLDLSDYDWTQLPGSYDEDDRLHTHLGSANVIVDFAAKRIGLKVKKDGGANCFCYPLDEIPIDIVGEWLPDRPPTAQR